MNFTTEEVMKKLELKRNTFYKLFKNNSEVLEPLRTKKGQVYFYSGEFVNKMKEIIDDSSNTKFVFKQQTNNVLDELKKQYETMISDLKTDKERLNNEKDELRNQLNMKENLLIEKTNKVETLLVGLSKVLNDRQLEDKTKSNEVVEQVQKELETKDEIINSKDEELEKVKQELESNKEKIQNTEKLEQAYETQVEIAKKYNQFKREKQKRIEDLKEEYNQIKINLFKKRKLKKQIEEEQSREFEFIIAVV